ncbi:hypothetical protein ILUMI_15394 [Ignelater luminosus]|uniref:Uncharacterized protein n=1 Tax=Ignelater luminosus TaxID=2038154 RepID=A0A8K0CQK8_IGNLU|nr:hypothetical protein ILUMI_15394 [Ignelater luminosus]
MKNIQVMTEMGKPYSNMELASFMSCSKGHVSECGSRAGFAEILIMCPKVKTLLYKAIMAMSCPPITGQARIEAAVRPPKKGEPSYDLFIKEKEDILNLMKVGLYLIHEVFPPKALEAAKRQNQSPDKLYADETLENGGICVIPGEATGQVSGTYHFRIALLPTDEMRIVLDKLEAFHKECMNGYR